MWMTLFSLLRMLLPFLKEALLEGGTVRNWIAKNKLITAFIVMLTLMFFAMLVMTDLIVKERARIAQLKNDHTALIYRYNGLVGRYNNLRAVKLTCTTDLETSNTRLSRLKILVADSCPEDSDAYRTLVAGVETLDVPLEVEPVRWCQAVKQADLEVEGIRQRYLRECQ